MLAAQLRQNLVVGKIGDEVAGFATIQYNTTYGMTVPYTRNHPAFRGADQLTLLVSHQHTSSHFTNEPIRNF